MNETIIQIIPAPSNLMYGYDGGTAQPVACLALVELADGDREIRAMSLTRSSPEQSFSLIEGGIALSMCRISRR